MYIVLIWFVNFFKDKNYTKDQEVFLYEYLQVFVDFFLTFLSNHYG